MKFKLNWCRKGKNILIKIKPLAQAYPEYCFLRFWIFTMWWSQTKTSADWQNFIIWHWSLKCRGLNPFNISMVYLTKKVSHDLLGLQFHRFIGVVSHLSTSSNNPNGSLQEEALCKETEKSPILYYHPAFGMDM